MHNLKNIFIRILIMSTIIGIICLFGIFFQNFMSYSVLFNNINLKIKGNQFININKIEKKINPLLTETLLSINIESIKDSISSFKFINSVQVSRILPNTLVIQVLEKQPLVLVSINENNMFIENNGNFILSDTRSISFFPVPVITVVQNTNNVENVTNRIYQLFKYVLDEYPLFYDNLSEVVIDDEQWIFISDGKTRIYASSKNIFTQILILKSFENTIYPNRELNDYSYIDLRISEQVVVKEKYRKG